uniref:Alpha-carbonic anhydrase domain-containing protein n=1 Tax=Capra hircus TaxID=9925 RepID=A0A8C2R8E2_CAPHI
MVLNKPLVERNNLLFLLCLVLCIEGPVHWNEFFPIADGDQQSPIEIKTKEVRYDSSLRPLGIKYDASSAKIISNSGHSFNVDFDDTDDKSDRIPSLRESHLPGSSTWSGAFQTPSYRTSSHTALRLPAVSFHSAEMSNSCVLLIYLAWRLAHRK